jgi:hypothetical protein
LITTNWAILGLAIFQTNREYDFFESLAFVVVAGCGFTLALVLMAPKCEATELANLPGRCSGSGPRSDYRGQPRPELHGLRWPPEFGMMDWLAPARLAFLLVRAFQALR